MRVESKHLERIMAKQNRIATLQVVFVDIEKYSKRRTLTQTEVIDRFTECLGKALTEISKAYINYAQSNDINFQTDIITIPTGDGAAIIFSFDGLHDIHLSFAKELLKEIYESNVSTPCEKYNEQGWCNCHPNFGVRVGISEGRGIIYRDINENYNVAGGVINLASRVMGLGDKNRILFTKDAFQQIIDMVDDANLIDRFVEFKDVPIKHNIKIDVYQYKGEGEAYISAEPPEDLALSDRHRQAVARFFGGIGLPADSRPEIEPNQMVGFMENMANLFSPSQAESNLKPAIDVKKEDAEK